MRITRVLSIVVCSAALTAVPPVTAATITHSTLADFQTGLSTGSAAPMGVFYQSGVSGAGVMVMPPIDTSPTGTLVGEDFTYSSLSAAQSAGWIVEQTNQTEVPSIDPGASGSHPSDFLFSGDTPADPSRPAPAAGALRIWASHPMTADDPTKSGNRTLAVAVSPTPLTGDFAVETHLSFPNARVAGDKRVHGIIIAQPVLDNTGTKVTDIALNDPNQVTNSSYLLLGAREAQFMLLGYRDNGKMSNGVAVTGLQQTPSLDGFTGSDVYIRVVKRGDIYTIWAKSTNKPDWTFIQWWKAPQLAGTTNAPVAVGVFEKDWDTSTTANYFATDYDYLHVNRLGSDLTGTYSNVMDAGTKVDWMQMGAPSFYSFGSNSANYAPNGPVPPAYFTLNREGLKVQVRAGNVKDPNANTLTDAGPFVGPDGTVNTYYTDDVAGTIPNGQGKQYLEYKLTMDGAIANLPMVVRNVSATYQPAGAATVLATGAADFGADATGTQVQPGDGDLSLARTELWRDDFNASYSFTNTGDTSNGWTFTNISQEFNYGAAGSANTSERPGYLRLNTGYEQNIWSPPNQTSGLFLLKDLATALGGTIPDNFEVETKVNWPVSQSRNAVLVIAQNVDPLVGNVSYVGVGLSRAHGYSNNYLDIGAAGDAVVNNAGQSTLPNNVDYGTRTLQLRLAKTTVTVNGTPNAVFTASYRDPLSNSPSWRVLFVYNAGASFTPVSIGFEGKAGDDADQSAVPYDFDYIKVSSLATTGTRDISLTLPSGAKADALLLIGEPLTPQNLKAQVDDGTGNFVGPGNNAANYFSVNERSLPDAVKNLSPLKVRLYFDGAQTVGVPTVHSVGVSYALPGSAIVHDSTFLDFNAGTTKTNLNLSTSGTIVNGGAIVPGTPATDNQNYTVVPPAVPAGYAWENPTNPQGQSTYSYTENPGWLRMHVNINENLWNGAANKYYALMRQTTPVTGDFEVETHIVFPNGREKARQNGIAIWQDNKNAVFLGVGEDVNGNTYASLLTLDNDTRVQSLTTNGTYPDSEYWLKIRKIGKTYTFWIKGVSDTDWVQLFGPAAKTINNLNTATVGLLGKSFAGNPPTVTGMDPAFPVDYDYLTVTPLSSNGVFESRALDLGATGLTPVVDNFGGNAPAVQLQFRAADTAADLANATYVGPDGTSATTFAGNYTGALPAALAGKQLFQYKATLPLNSYQQDMQIVGQASTTQPLSRDDAIQALKIAAGIAQATAADQARLNVNTSGTPANGVDLMDAAQILRTVMGL